MHLDIDQINIRLKGVSPGVGKQVTDGLGLEIQRLLGTDRAASAGTVDAGTVKTGANPNAGEIRRSIAARIAGSIKQAKGGRS